MKKEGRKSTLMTDNSFGLASAIFGAQSLILPLLSPVLLPSIAFGVIGLVMSSKQNKFGKNSWSKWGKALSVIGILLSVLAIVLNFTLRASPSGLLPQNLP